MKTDPPIPAAGRILTINGGSSSIKFAVFAQTSPLKLLLSGSVDRIGSAEANFSVSSADNKPIDSRTIGQATHEQAAEQVADWLAADDKAPVAGVGHRIVHGGLHVHDHQLITDDLLHELDHAEQFDPAHLPR